MGFVTTEQEWTVMQMREILFRGKRIDDGKTVEGLYIFDGFKHYIVKFHTDENAFGTLYPVDETFEVTPETVGQFTGLTDRNGKRIFEGDIIDASAERWDACGPAGHDSPIIPVAWSKDNCGFDPFANYDCDCGVFIYANNCIVIGNIHDNPELLEK